MVKHECTKRALNKAIQLANLLIDELQQESKTARQMRHFDNSQSSPINIRSRFHTPEIQNRRFAKHELSIAIDQKKEDSSIYQTFRDINPQNQSSSELRKISCKRSTANELKELTSLIRRTKNSPIIANARVTSSFATTRNHDEWQPHPLYLTMPFDNSLA